MATILVSFTLFWYIFSNSPSDSTGYMDDFTRELTHNIPFRSNTRFSFGPEQTLTSFEEQEYTFTGNSYGVSRHIEFFGKFFRQALW
jgi:hypothetical protein